MNAAKTARYEVIPSRVWQRNDGARASIYGALPWVHPAEEKRWRMIEVGWTVLNPLTNEVGMGRPAFETREQAQAFADQLGAPSRMSIAD